MSVPTGPVAAPPRVTVITPAFNVAPYLGETMQTVLDQTMSDLEYLVVDDGSSDDTAAVATGFALTDVRVRVLEGAHAGSSAARNQGLRAARAPYVAFCDGDDRWDPRFLARALEVLEEAPAEVGAVFVASRRIDVTGALLDDPPKLGLGDYDGARTLAGNCPQGNGSCLVLRRSTFAEAGLFDVDLRSGVDLDMWMRIHLLSRTPLFRYVPEALVDWRVRPGAISRDESRRVRALDEIFRRYDTVLSPTRRARSRRWPAVLAFYAGEDDTARRWARQVATGDRWYFLRDVDGIVLALFLLLGGARGRWLRAFVARRVAAPVRAWRARRLATGTPNR